MLILLTPVSSASLSAGAFSTFLANWYSISQLVNILRGENCSIVNVDRQRLDAESISKASKG